MNPLHENCREFRVDSAGKIIGVKLGITPIGGSAYEVYSVRLRNEYEAQGQTIAACHVVDENGIPTGNPVRLAWPGAGPDFSDSGLPGNPNNVHMIVNKYWPPAYGPLALYVGAQHNNPQSDIVWGLGLPMGHHVSYDVTFRKRSITQPPPIDPPTDPGLTKRVAALETDILALRTLLRQWTGD